MINNRQRREFPSLELCKKIGHLFPDAEWWWKGCLKDIGGNAVGNISYGKPDSNSGKCYPAPTVVEMLGRLPKQIKGCDLHIDCNAGDGYCVYYDMMEPDPDITDELLPNALALMLAHLDKEGVL